MYLTTTRIYTSAACDAQINWHQLCKFCTCFDHIYQAWPGQSSSENPTTVKQPFLCVKKIKSLRRPLFLDWHEAPTVRRTILGSFAVDTPTLPAFVYPAMMVVASTWLCFRTPNLCQSKAMRTWPEQILGWQTCQKTSGAIGFFAVIACNSILKHSLFLGRPRMYAA